MHRITPAEIANYSADRYLRRKEIVEKIKNSQPQLGPRLKLYHYIYDEKILMKEAIKKLLSEFPSVSVDDAIRWYNEEEKKRKKERNGSDEAR